MSDVHVTQARRLLDRDFRWRSTEVSRMEAFADAVFALVLGLLFLRAVPPENFDDLRAAMKSLLPFAITFAMLGTVWVEHHLFFRRYNLCDKSTFFGNLVLLFLVLFYAYPLKFLFTLMCVQWFGPIGAQTRETLGKDMGVAEAQSMMLFYGIGFGAINLTLALLYRHALRRAPDLGLDVVERHATATSMLHCLVLVGFAALSLALALAGALPASGMCYFGIGPALTVLGSRRGAQQRALVRARVLPAPD